MSPDRTRINLRGGSYVVVPGAPLEVWHRLVDPDGIPHPRSGVHTTWVELDGGDVLVNVPFVDSLMLIGGES